MTNFNPRWVARGAAYDLRDQEIQAKSMFTRLVGTVEHSPLPLSGYMLQRLTGWVFYSANPGNTVGARAGLYLGGAEVLVVSTVLGEYYIAPAGLIVNLGSGSAPFTAGYISNVHATTITFGDATTQTTAPVAGAPTSADYLVGTANGGLSAEIVVGTSPGGELGGSWASPTVDATHSGSAHSAYAALAATPGGELGGTYASPTVDTLHASTYHPIVVAQSTAQSTDGTTLVSSNTLTVAAGANQVWLLDFDIPITTNSAANDFTTEGFKFDIDGPTGYGGAYEYSITQYLNAGGLPTFVWGSYVTSPATDQDITTAKWTASMIKGVIKIRGRFTTSSTTGSFTFRFAKSTDTEASNVTVQVGASLVATRIS